MAEDMQANGWGNFEPIDVAKGDDLFIHNGHHRGAAAARLGIDVPDVVRDLPFAYKNSVCAGIQK